MTYIKNILSGLFFLFLIGCNNSSDTSINENKEDTIMGGEEMELPQVDEIFPELTTFLSGRDSSFSVEGFEGGETEIKNDSALQKINDETLNPFLPYLVFNADSSYAIDLVTYNYIAEKRGGRTKLADAGPDFEVGLIDYKNRTRKPLLFFGTMGIILDARWVNNQTAMIAGANEVSGDSIRPVIWKYEIPTKAWSVYTYNKPVPADVHNYPKKWLNRKE